MATVLRCVRTTASYETTEIADVDPAQLRSFTNWLFGIPGIDSFPMARTSASGCLLLIVVLLVGACGGAEQGLPPASTQCPSNTVRVTDGSCAARCTSNFECSTGCCATLSNGTAMAQACSPPSFCPQGGSSGGGTGAGTLACSSPSTGGTCPQSGQLWCGNRSCCPATNPIWWNGNCYTSTQAAAQAGATSSSCFQCQALSAGAAGGGASGAGGGTGACAYERNHCVSCRVTTGKSHCTGAADGAILDCTNNCADDVFLTYCMAQANTSQCSCGADRIRAGRSWGTSQLSNGAWVCHYGGSARTYAVSYAEGLGACRTSISVCR